MDTGNTTGHSNRPASDTVHPRGYGEHNLRQITSIFDIGSSPWIRGTPNDIKNKMLKGRFIPVDTGNTVSLIFSDITSTVHPRGYGEHVANALNSTGIGGSSPWIRGTHSKREVPKALIRFIPVDTGNTPPITYSYFVIAVHPRGYGEHR